MDFVIHVDGLPAEGEAVLYDLAWRMARKAREWGCEPSISGGFDNIEMPDDFGVDEINEQADPAEGEEVTVIEAPAAEAAGAGGQVG